VNPRTTGILFVVAVVVIGGVWWNENVRKGQAEVAEAEARELFPDVTVDDVAWVALETTDRRDARVERRDGGFRLVEPLDFAVDRTAVDGIVGALAEVKSEAVIESPQAADVYGLGDDADTVRFGAGDDEHVLRLGAKTPVGSNTYARRDDDPAVYTIPTYRANALRRSLDDLRDKRVLPFDREAVDRVELSWPGGEVALARGEDGWRVVAPLEDDADDETVDALLSDLSFLRAEGFVDDPPPDPGLGLDRPAFEARLTAGAEAQEEEGGQARIFHLLVGDDLGGNERAARGREAATFRIPAERLDDFPRRVAAYRFKQLASFVPSDARQLEIAFHDPEAGAHVVIAEHGEDGWTSSPETLAPGRAARMVAELSTLHGEDIVADAMPEAEQAELGLVPGNVVLRVRGEPAEDGPGEVLAEVVLGEIDPDQGIAARARGSDRIYRIDYELAEHLPISLEALRNRFLSEGEGAAPDA
jgi:hypothetical protein